ncbi:MAG TPA: S41 family peptidase [Steroidobacteraceae bacterium]|nr:S41 family peptidase [Steroidobacteraceae bacterium]
MQQIGTLLAEKYVDQPLGREVAAKLVRAYRDGRFDSFETPEEFAAALTDFLRPYDGHFAVMRADDATTDEPVGEPVEEPAAFARRQNFGFRRVEVWPGNVGYLDLRYFEDPDLAGSTAAASMALLANTDAVVIDLRQNGGGSPHMVQLLCSYFLGADEPILLNSLYWREGDVTQQFWTLPVVPGGRRPDLPVYVLTSGRTGSAAEEFAYNLQTRERALIVGEATAGAANPGDLFPLTDGYAIFISTGKAINPVTDDNWEGRGVVPDVVVGALEAEHVAYAKALDALAESHNTAARAREIAWAREALQARVSPRELTAQEKAAYAAIYGSRQIVIDSGELRFLRGRRPPRLLEPLGDDRFLLAGVEDRRIEFERDASGRVVRLVEVYLDGKRSAHPRSR